MQGCHRAERCCIDGSCTHSSFYLSNTRSHRRMASPGHCRTASPAERAPNAQQTLIRNPTAAQRCRSASAMPPSAAPARAAASRVLDSIQQLPDVYRGALLDQFGVLHDGVEPYPGAIEAVANWHARGMRLLIISNSSRRAAGALKNLELMGFDPTCFAGVITSGEVTHRHLSARPDAWWQGLGRCCMHLTWSARGAISLEGLGLDVTTDSHQADFILAHGTEALGSSADGGAATPCSLDRMRELLAECAAAREVPMVVANPDVVTVSGSELRVMPGTLARHYASLGGQVVLMGKPAAVIYQGALEMLGLPAHEVVAVGDSLEHDIGGAQAAGVDSLFVLGGIHCADVGLAADGGNGGGDTAAGGYSFSKQQLDAAYVAHGVLAPEYVVPYFALR